jgi:hypothetical protein
MFLNLPPLAGSASPLADSDPFSTSSQNTTDLPAYLQGVNAKLKCPHLEQS